ncbi:hypothetical protein DE146DRAFT_607177 [Phaeosphaeria sp. MPI-PUGE-AT-0046c]|nr:hypothetical protein DE146DRAFT_607177 [Phaeosphaeria sp. MPI-PUGE-AT-0046c]
MADQVAEPEWPNERLKILIPTWSLLVISNLFVVWRVIYGFMKARKFMLSDFLLVLAAMLNTVASSTSHIVVDSGLGRHIMDPSVLTTIPRYSYYLWVSQIVNIIAVACLKWSVCAWLLVLDFSRIYQVFVWLSILMVTSLGFLAPVLTLFGCTPLRANWDYAYQPRKCWAVGNLALSYTQGISNILTDIVYMAAPIIYLSRIQLSKRTQLGIRIVFLLTIPAAVCSVFKTVELKTLTQTQDPTWDAMQSSQKTPGYEYGLSRNIRMGTFQGSKAYHSRLPDESVLDNDGDSDRAVLEDEENKRPGIMKTTEVTVSEEREGSSSKGSEASHTQSNDDWPVPARKSSTGSR